MRAERGFNLPSIPPQWQLLLSLDELHLFVFPCVSPALHRLLLLLQSPPFSLRDPQSRGFSAPFEGILSLILSFFPLVIYFFHRFLNASHLQRISGAELDAPDPQRDCFCLPRL